jgi:hypothetical protein
MGLTAGRWTMERGSVRQRGRGRWELQVDAAVDSATGRQWYVPRTVRGSRRAAVTALAELVAEVLLLVGLAAISSGCRDVVADRLASLPVMTTVPDGAEVMEWERGGESSGWPTRVIARVVYRVADGGDPELALNEVRQVALDTGWDVEPSRLGDSVRATTTTDDGSVRLPAFIPLGSYRNVVTVTLAS